MKISFKTIVALVFSAFAVNAGAQNMYDAITFSRNEYTGSARTLGLGNAVSAVGGDLGTIGINPAGSAVANYGQFTISPGLSLSMVGSQYSPVGETSYGATNNYNRTRMTLPNIGLSAVLRTGRTKGVKSISFAVVSNQTAQYNNYSSAYGRNSYTSKVAEFAASSNGIEESVLSNYNSFQNSDVSWDLLTAYQGGMFGNYGTDGEYVGVTEALDGTSHYVPGALSQSSYRNYTGSKNDLVFNVGLNISDKIFVGLNVGIPSIDYKYAETFYEIPMNADEFAITFEGNTGEKYDTYFKSSFYQYQYLANMDGIYAKIGAIVAPVKGLRLAAAFQTPTSFTVNESWQYAASTSYGNSYFDDSSSSPEGTYSYYLRSPYIATFGAAYTFGTLGLVSVDYELTDYSVMKFSEVGSDSYWNSFNDPFLALNNTNKHFAGVSHNLRIGAELKLSPLFALRAGYSFVTSPERKWTDSTGAEITADDYMNDFDSYYNNLKTLVSSSYYNDITRTYSLGVGYSSNGSFFCDAAVSCTVYPSWVFAPYYDYSNVTLDGSTDVLSPRILSNRKLLNAVVTFGWRF